jgi:DNA-binding response OmpR family regulator
MALHIVHLEDEVTLREAIEIALHELQPDADLRQFADSDSALTYIKDHASTIDLYLLDIRVPGRFNGVEVAEQISRMHSPGLIVFTSAFEPPRREILNELGARYLRKPYSLEATAKTLLEWVRQRQ